jgi:hypothetical protein
MVGNIQGAWLSDSTVETITSTELVTNGTFTSNVTGWTNAGSSFMIEATSLNPLSTLSKIALMKTFAT